MEKVRPSARLRIIVSTSLALNITISMKCLGLDLLVNAQYNLIEIGSDLVTMGLFKYQYSTQLPSQHRRYRYSTLT